MKKHTKLNINEFNDSLNDWIEELPYLEKSKNTIKAYANAVNQFSEFVRKNDITEITKLTLIDYKKELEQEKDKAQRRGKTKREEVSSSNTINLRLTVINRFFSDIGHSDIKVDLLKDTTSNIETTVPSEDEINRILDTAHDLNKEKIALLLETLLFTGCRISELEDLTVESIKPKNRFFITTNKGKTRYIFIPKRLNRKLRRYCKNNGIESGIVFSGRDQSKLIDQSYIRRELKAIGKKAGVDVKKCHPHALRHAFARRYVLTPNTNPYWLSIILGHSLTVTALYTKGSIEDFKNSIDSVEEHYFNLEKEQKKSARKRKK